MADPTRRKHPKTRRREIKRSTGSTGDPLRGDRPGARGNGGAVALLDALRRLGPLSVDDLVTETGQRPGAVLHSLGSLEVAGHVAAEGDTFHLVRRPRDQAAQRLA